MAQAALDVQPRKAWDFSVREYCCMLDVGVLCADERVELLDGAIVPMPAMYSPHAAAVRAFTELFGELLKRRANLSVQCPIHLSPQSQPEPDVALLRPRADWYRHRDPRPGDVLLVVEVGDSSRRRDERRKQPMYARAGIAEVWLVNLRAARLSVCRDPRGTEYADIAVYGPGDAVAPLSFPDLVIPLVEIFGADAGRR